MRCDDDIAAVAPVVVDVDVVVFAGDAGGAGRGHPLLWGAATPQDGHQGEISSLMYTMYIYYMANKKQNASSNFKMHKLITLMLDCGHFLPSSDT